LEKTQNDIAKARRKAEEKRASAEAKRGLKLAKVLELANFMKAVGRVPTKRSFFSPPPPTRHLASPSLQFSITAGVLNPCCFSAAPTRHRSS
jgi:hypothetical protein